MGNRLAKPLEISRVGTRSIVAQLSPEVFRGGPASPALASCGLGTGSSAGSGLLSTSVGGAGLSSHWQATFPVLSRGIRPTAEQRYLPSRMPHEQTPKAPDVHSARSALVWASSFSACAEHATTASVANRPTKARERLCDIRPRKQTECHANFSQKPMPWVRHREARSGPRASADGPARTGSAMIYGSTPAARRFATSFAPTTEPFR